MGTKTPLTKEDVANETWQSHGVWGQTTLTSNIMHQGDIQNTEDSIDHRTHLSRAERGVRHRTSCKEALREAACLRWKIFRDTFYSPEEVNQCVWRCGKK